MGSSPTSLRELRRAGPATEGGSRYRSEVGATSLREFAEQVNPPRRINRNGRMSLIWQISIKFY